MGRSHEKFSEACLSVDKIKKTLKFERSAVEETPKGTFWRLPNGLFHREYGPAIIRPDGGQEWWFEGKLHRTDGPAVIWPDGSMEWYENGILIKSEWRER